MVREEGEWVEMVCEAGEDEMEDPRPFKALLPGDKGRPVPSVLAAGYSHLVVLARFEVRAVCGMVGVGGVVDAEKES